MAAKIFSKMSESVASVLRGANIIPLLIRHRLWVHGFTLLSCVLALIFAARLELRTDFAELLPQHLPSVQALKEASRRMGGTGLLIVGVETSNFAAGKHFLDDLAAKVDPWVGDKLRFYEYRFDKSRDFAQRYGLYYLNNEQLKQFRDYLKTQISEGWDSAIGGLLGLDDNEAEPKSPKAGQSIEKILEQHPAGPSIGAVMRYPEGYLSAYNGKVLAFAMRPKSSSLSISATKALVADTEKVIQELNPKAYDPKMQIVLAGSLPQAIEEFETIQKDIVGTALELIALIVTVLFIFLWSFRMIGLLCLNLVVAVMWTFALTYLHIGYLNAQTAFLGSLVVGTGINYGVIYICRFMELRRKGVELRSALEEALDGTMLPTFVASLTTAASFIVLMMASNQGLAQFGFIGSIGVLFCWICSFFILPLWLFELESRSRQARLYINPVATRLRPLGVKIGNAIVAKRAWILGAAALMAISCVSGVMILAENPLEYNFDNVRNKTSTSAEVEAARDRVYEAFPTSLTPSLAFADNEADARLICPEVRRLKETLPPERNVIRSCGSLYDLLPAPSANPSEQQRLMSEIQDLLKSPRLKFSDDAEFLRGMGEKLSSRAPTFEDFPEQILRPYREQDGRLGLFATINPKGGGTLNDARNLLNFTSSLSPLRIGPERKEIRVAGDSFVLADILRQIKTEGPFLTISAFLAVVAIAFFLAGGLWSGLLMASCLVIATWLMLGIQGNLELKYNFFNFIALPLTFGIGVDYPINVFIRYRQERYRSYGEVFASSGMAVFLCAFTTIIGYYTLIGASSQALAGFGKLAIIGEFCCLFCALFVLPALLSTRAVSRRFRRSTPVIESGSEAQA